MDDGPHDAAIEVEDLRKRFGSTVALDGLDLRVERGEVHGFLGPNGAGKSTTVRVLLGLVRADGGRLRVLGRDPRRDADEVHRRLAYVPGDVALWPQLSGGETVDLLLRARGLDPARTDRDALLDRFHLDPTKRARTYSKGNRQKVALVAALAAPVDLLILDEPTSGLDPLMEQEFAACVGERAAEGTTVLLSSHVLSEVEHLATRVTIVRDGRTVSTGRISDLQHLHRSRVRAELPSDADVDGLLRGAGPGGLDVERTDDGVVVSGAVDAEHLPGLLGALSRARVRSLTCAPPSLEELFGEFYRSTP